MHPLLSGRHALILVASWIAACLIAAPAILVFYLGEVPVQYGKGLDTPTEGSVYNATEQDIGRFPWLAQMADWFDLSVKYCSNGCQFCTCPYTQPALRGVVQRDAIAHTLQLQRFVGSNGETYYYDYFSYQDTFYHIRLGSPDLSNYLFYGTIFAGTGSVIIGIIWSKQISLRFHRK